MEATVAAAVYPKRITAYHLRDKRTRYPSSLGRRSWPFHVKRAVVTAFVNLPAIRGLLFVRYHQAPVSQNAEPRLDCL
jgi:hypothetical protein